MTRFVIVSLIGLAACHTDFRRAAVRDAETMVRSQVGNRSLGFRDVQFTGDDRSGQTCGYYVLPTSDGGETSVRFIVFIDGGGGQNPFIDDHSAPFPANKEDFAVNWRTQCLDLGYKEG